MTIVALIVAAGSGSRIGGETPKQYLDIGGKTMLRQCVDVFLSHPEISAVKVVIGSDHENFYHAAVKGLQLLPPATGGKTRQESVLNGLEELTATQKNPPSPLEGEGQGEGYNSFTHVLIHDAARPFVTHRDISALIAELKKSDAAILAIPVTDTIKQVENGTITATPERSTLWQAQTPQGFRLDLIIAAHRKFLTQQPDIRLEKNNSPLAGESAQPRRTGEGYIQQSFTDDAAIMEAAGYDVAIVHGSAANRKITTPEDFTETAENVARTAIGYDVHRFIPSTKGLIRLGGIDIPHHNTLEGHSDADVVLHAITDALLGTIADGDIGQHFSPKDPKWQGCDSSHFLADAVARVSNAGGKIINIDVTIIGEEPKISPHRQAMRERISAITGVDLATISVKATTTEGLGFTGRSEGLACMAIASVKI